MPPTANCSHCDTAQTSRVARSPACSRCAPTPSTSRSAAPGHVFGSCSTPTQLRTELQHARLPTSGCKVRRPTPVFPLGRPKRRRAGAHMTRFWKREDRSIEQLLRANRPEPRDELSSSILQSISETPLRTAPRRAHSGRRLGLALALTVAALSLASVLGGISAASAGLGGIVRVATNAVTPSHTQSNTAGGSVNDNAN